MVIIIYTANSSGVRVSYTANGESQVACAPDITHFDFGNSHHVNCFEGVFPVPFLRNRGVMAGTLNLCQSSGTKDFNPKYQTDFDVS